MPRFTKSDDIELDIEEAKKFISGSSSNNKPNALTIEEASSPEAEIGFSKHSHPWEGLNPDAAARITYQLRFNDYYKEALDLWSSETGRSKHDLLMPLVKEALDNYIRQKG